jgi:hypothetical protein
MVTNPYVASRCDVCSGTRCQYRQGYHEGIDKETDLIAHRVGPCGHLLLFWIAPPSSSACVTVRPDLRSLPILRNKLNAVDESDFRMFAHKLFFFSSERL